jgi:hypothetical protein
MFVDLSLYCANGSAVGETRVLLDALRYYGNAISQAGFAQTEGDGTATLSALLSVSLQLSEGLLDQTEMLEEVLVPTGTQTDNLPDYLTAYYPTANDATQRIISQRAVLQIVLDRNRPPRATDEEGVNPNTETGAAPGVGQ